jgi:Ankyrin repeats (many copies)
MTPNDDDTRDEELLARYRRAGDADAARPSDTVRTAILAESRRVADELAKQESTRPIDVSRPAANDSRWKITVFGTAGAALLAALLFVPRYWEKTPPAQVSTASAPAPATAPAPAPAPAPEAESSAPARQSPSDSQSNRIGSKPAGSPSLQLAAPAPSAPSAAQNYAPVSPSAAPLAAPPPTPAARVRPLDLSAYTVGSAALSKRADRAAPADSALKPATLQSAVAQGDVAQAASLLDQGAVIDARDEAGRTPLMLAVTQDQPEIVRLLLARGADPNAADNTGHTPLQQATKRNLQDVAALLEQAGAH